MEYIYDYNMNIRKFLMCALAGAPLLSFAVKYARKKKKCWT